MNLIVLKETNDNYQPGDEEIISYGQYLGLKFPEDEKFKLLLREALKAPVPPGWQVCQTNDQQHNIVFRNIKTQQVQQAHPLDGYYQQKIKRLKSLTNNLQIQTILQQRQSWLKQSSELFGPSRQSGGVDYSLKNQQFINEIDEQESVYDQQEQKIQEVIEQKPRKKVIITNKITKSPRIYRRKNPTIKIQQLKQSLLNLNYIPNFSIKDIKQMKQPHFQSFQQNQKLKQVITLASNLEKKKQHLKKIQKQRKKKLQYLQLLKKQLQITKF